MSRHMFQQRRLELIDGKLEAGLEDGLIAGGVGTTGPGVGGGGLTGL